MDKQAQAEIATNKFFNIIWVLIVLVFILILIGILRGNISNWIDALF